MYDLLPRRIKVLIFVEMPSSVRCQFLYGKDMGGIDFAACRRKIEANSTLVRTVIRGLQKKGYKKTPQENSYGVWDRKKALILSYQCLFFRRYLILNLTPRSLPPKNIVLPTNSMFSYPEAGKEPPFLLSSGVWNGCQTSRMCYNKQQTGEGKK